MSLRRVSILLEPQSTYITYQLDFDIVYHENIFYYIWLYVCCSRRTRVSQAWIWRMILLFLSGTLKMRCEQVQNLCIKRKNHRNDCFNVACVSMISVCVCILCDDIIVWIACASARVCVWERERMFICTRCEWVLLLFTIRVWCHTAPKKLTTQTNIERIWAVNNFVRSSIWSEWETLNLKDCAFVSVDYSVIDAIRETREDGEIYLVKSGQCLKWQIPDILDYLYEYKYRAIKRSQLICERLT